MKPHTNIRSIKALWWLTALAVALSLLLYQLAFSAGRGGGKVEICHIPGGDFDNAITITVSTSALDAHLKHGDYKGECSEQPEPEPVSECEVGNYWQIGKLETTPLSNPVDEFNWDGSFSSFPTYSNPFVIATSKDSTFPWTSNYSKNYATDLKINFEYAPEESAEVKLTLSWSPGKSGTEKKEVWLDGDLLEKWTREGEAKSGWWEEMPLYADTLNFDLDEGTHTLNLKQTSGDGTLWDYVKLDITSCDEQD